MLKILFVCTGNICRSPTAEVVFRDLVAKKGLSDQFEIDSCGTHGYHIGEGADPRSCRFAKTRGYDLSAHVARQITSEDFVKYDWILVMDKMNLRAFSEQSEQTIVPDPYYGNDKAFLKVIDYCEDAAQGFLTFLQKAHQI